jgi:hypothetical protein
MSESWLPPAPPPPPFDEWALWAPASLEGVDVAGLSYIVVDEIVKPTCVLAVTDWPRIDESGRVRFRLDVRPHLVRVAVSELAGYLAEHRAVEDNKDREVRIGDVYAAVARTEKLPAPESEAEARELTGSELTPLDWLEPPIHDITVAGRETAKIALYGALAPVLDPDEAERLTETD